jgi:hypothetical protein
VALHTPAGTAGDYLVALYSEQIGPPPSWLREVVPSSIRRDETDQYLRDLGAAVGTYTRTRLQDPTKFAADVEFVVNKYRAELGAEYDRVKHDPVALGQFYGNISGRVAFEMATLIVPVTKVGTAARVANAGADAAGAIKISTATSDAATGAARLGTATNAAEDAATLSRRVDEAVTAGRASPTKTVSPPPPPPDPTRARVEANIAESRAARQASNFGEHIAREAASNAANRAEADAIARATAHAAAAKTPGANVGAVLRIGDTVIEDVNQTARGLTAAQASRPTAIADQLEAESARRVASGRAPLPNMTMGSAHAEIITLQRALDAGITRGQDATITLRGQMPCDYCLNNLRSMVEASDLNSLTVRYVSMATDPARLRGRPVSGVITYRRGPNGRVVRVGP